MKCEKCNIDMIEKTSLHTDHIGGIALEEQIYLDYIDGTKMTKGFFGKEKEEDNEIIRRVRARVCPKCGKVDLFIDVNDTENDF